MLPASKRATRKSNRKQGPPADVEASRSPGTLAKLPPAVQKLYAVHKSDKHKREEATVNHELVYSISSRKKTEVEGIDFSPQKRKAVTEDTPDAPRKKEKNLAYAPKRAMVETESTATLVTTNLVCSHCLDASNLQMIFPSCGVTSTPTLMCSGCNLYEVAKVSKTGMFRSSTHEALIDYDANFKYVLSYVACGDGPTEADRLLTFLSLPNASTMRTNTFKHIEEKCHSYIATISKECLENNLIEEVRRTNQEDASFDFDKWKHNFKAGRKNTDVAQVNSSMDMAWQKKSSGLKYDSCSGHAFLYGVYSRKPIAMCLKSKYCSTCSWWDKNKPTSEVPIHSCTVNHEGSSGSMESDALLEMIITLWDEFHVRVRAVVTDDDSTMKANCKWSNEEWLAFFELDIRALTIGWTVPNPNKPNSKRRPIKRKGGSLPVRIPEPVFLADPAHRKKTLKSHLYKMLKRRVAERNDLHEGDILRLSHFYHCMVRQLGLGEEKDYVTKGQAVLEHHFDCHEYCGDFCSRKVEKENENEEIRNKKIYRCKVKDATLYEELKDILAPFLTHEALVEVSHGWDTNANESMNNTISWLAPKNKTYSGTVSLRNRVNMALSIQSLGYDVYWTRLFRELGLEMDAATEHRLKQHEKLRQYRLQQSKLTNNKRKRQVQTYIKISKYFDKLRADRDKGRQYMPGVGMDVAVVEEDTDEIAIVGKRVRSNKKQCPHCGVYGHVTTRSKFCLVVNEEAKDGLAVYSTENKDTDNPLDNAAQAMLEISLLDQLPCVTDGLRELEDSLGDEDD